MKRIVLSTLGLLLIATCNMVFAEKQIGAQLEYKSQDAQLGTLYTDELEPVQMEIEFSNEGDEPLVISQVRGCCGTRIKNWSKQPVMPGEKGIVEIEFRLAPRPHNINRTISVMSNDPRGMRVFRIRGEVADPESTLFESETQSSAGPRVP